MQTRPDDIDAVQLDRMLLAGAGGAWILDARDPADAERWRPDGPGLAGYINVSSDEFVNDEDAAIARLPEAPLWVICARGNSSKFVTGRLRERGLNARNIAGGMKNWAAYHRTVRVNASSDEFDIYQVVRPAKGCLSYLIVAGGEAVAVDCTRYAGVYQELAEKMGARLIAVIDTHLHADHISGSAGLASDVGSSYHLADEDAAGSTLQRDAIPRQFDVGSVNVRVLSMPVPGHTLGSTALLIADRYLISGDTLLPDGVGRPDLGNKAHEWTEYLYDSLSGVLGKLDPKTAVLPAHVASVNQYDARGACVRVLGELLAAQASADRGAFVARVEEIVSRSTQPPEYAEIRRVNLGESKPAERIEELEVGVNRCALSS